MFQPVTVKPPLQQLPGRRPRRGAGLPRGRPVRVRAEDRGLHRVLRASAGSPRGGQERLRLYGHHPGRRHVRHVPPLPPGRRPDGMQGQAGPKRVSYR